MLAGLLRGTAEAQTTTLRMAWYSDGNEGEVMADLLKRFEEQNKDIEVVLDQVPYKAINENLPVQLASGQGPDMARVVDMGGLSRYVLDMRPYLKDPPIGTEFRTVPAVDAPGGRHEIDPRPHDPAHLHRRRSSTRRYSSRRACHARRESDLGGLGEGGAGVATKVKAPFPIAIDRSGHRFYALAHVQGTKIFGDKWRADVVDEGFKRGGADLRLAQDGIMSKELWGSVCGTAYRGANEEFKNAQVVLYMSGTWQPASSTRPSATPSTGWRCPTLAARRLHQHAGRSRSGRHQDHQTSQGGGAGHGIPGQRACVAEYYSRTLFVPGHLGLRKRASTIRRQAARRRCAKGFHGEAANHSAGRVRAPGLRHNRIMFNAAISRLGQAISGETTLDEAYKRITRRRRAADRRAQ